MTAAEAELARRVSRLEARRFPDVMVWSPETSVSGLWEAMGSGWLIEEESLARFAALLEARLAAHKAPAGEDGPGSPATSPAGQEG